MHDVLIGIVAVLFFAAAGVYATHKTEIDFRAACTAVKGNAVYNGRHWECLK